MKKRVLAFIGFVTLGLTLASCNFVDILASKIKSIKLDDGVNAYVVGETFFDRSSLSIDLTYFNGTTESVTKNDVAIYMTRNSVSYNPSTAFTTAGEYYVTVQKNGVNSNTITVKVLAENQYVSNITVAGSATVEETSIKTLTLNVTPSDFTVPTECEISDTSKIAVTKKKDTSFEVKGLAAGNVTLTFKSKSSATTYFSVNFEMEVTIKRKTEIAQTYNDYIKNSYYTVSACPLEGNVNLLVIPVWFTDSENFINPDKKETVRNDIYKAYFGSESETGWESVSSFYMKESNNELNLSGTVSEWYECNLSSLTVAMYDTTSNPTPQNSLVKKAVNWYFSNHSDARSNYDSDNDKYLDGVMLIYGAPDDQLYTYQQGLIKGENMWAYCFWIQEAALSTITPNVYFWASYDFMYSSNKAYTQTGYSYGNGDTSHCLIDSHTYIHEMGHVLGLEDYYDYANGATSPAAGFSMQDNNVGSHDPFSLMAFGWADPYIPTESVTVRIDDFQSSHDVILLTPSWNSYNSPFDEYVLLELYSNTGLNKFDCDYHYRNRYAQGPQAVGIRVWHVDARLLKKSSRTLGSFTSPNVSVGSVVQGFNNTSTTARESEAHMCLHQDDYQKMNLLQLIRNSATKTYTDKSDLSAADLFTQGSTFSLNEFNKQFVKGTTLDNGSALGWSFSVNSIINNGDGTYSAVINLVKA